MKTYRVVENRCSNGKSAFYVEYRTDWWPFWQRVCCFQLGYFISHTFGSLIDAQRWVHEEKRIDATQPVTCHDIIHPIS